MDEQLRNEIQVEVKNLFKSDEETYRKYLESYTDRIYRHLKWILMIIGVTLIGGYAFLYGDTYAQIEQKVIGAVDKKIINYFQDNNIDKKVESQIEKTLIGKKFTEQVNEKATNLLRGEVGLKLNEAIDTQIASINSSDLLPRGTIVAWYSKESIPIGWAPCDGTQGTPDLRNKFIIGAAEQSEIGISIGKEEHFHQYRFRTETEVPTETAHAPDQPNQEQFGNYRHKHVVKYNGDTDPAPNIPPSIKIIYIMKL